MERGIAEFESARCGLIDGDVIDLNWKFWVSYGDSTVSPEENERNQKLLSVLGQA